MKIAFASCMSPHIDAAQPVWAALQAQQPDAVVLLGDSVYLDVPLGASPHPRTLQEFEFVVHGMARYRRQLAVPTFDALVRSRPVHAIWDDHDFLWNESYEEKAIANPRYAQTLRASRALFKCFVAALEARDPGLFPADASDFPLWQPDEPPPGYRLVQLAPDVALHLTDGRSWRLRKTLLGAAQRARIEQAMAALPAGTVHLLASGSVVQQEKGDAWTRFPGDYAWLLGLAERFDIVVLSGDVHANIGTEIRTPGGRLLYDATSSGAAMSRSATEFGPSLEHFATLDVDAARIEIRWFAKGGPDLSVIRIERANWRLA